MLSCRVHPLVSACNALSKEKHFSTDRGERVGGVSGRPAQEGVWSDPDSACVRCGERHPGRQDAVVLRGMAVERRSWSARLRSVWVSPLPSERADDVGCPLDAEEGNVLSACAIKATQPSSGSSRCALVR